MKESAIDDDSSPAFGIDSDSRYSPSVSKSLESVKMLLTSCETISTSSRSLSSEPDVPSFNWST